MSYGFSKVDIIGNLTDNIELKTTNSGKTVASFTLAVNETKETVSYLDCTAWESAAEVIAKYAKRGDQLFISGNLTQQRYESKDGSKRSRVVVIVKDFRFLRSKAKEEVAPDEVDLDTPVDLSGIPF